MLRVETAAAYEADVFSPDGVLKAETFARLRQAEDIERTARRKAAQHLRRAREMGRQIRRKARQEGYAEGLALFSAAVERLDLVRGDFGSRLEALLRKALLGVLGSMPTEEWLSAVLNEVVGELRGDAEIVVMAHPAHMRALAAAVATVKRRNDGLVPIRPEPNPHMAEDECLVYAGLEVVDVSLSVVVGEMIAALTAGPPDGPDERKEHADDAEVDILG